MVQWAKSEGKRLAEGLGMPHIHSCPLGLYVPEEDTRGARPEASRTPFWPLRHLSSL